MKFESHAEKAFWESVYLISLEKSGVHYAADAADVAVLARRNRMGDIKPKGKAA